MPAGFLSLPFTAPQLSGSCASDRMEQQVLSGAGSALGVLRQIQKLIWIVPEVLCAVAKVLTAAGGGTAINHRVPLLR